MKKAKASGDDSESEGRAIGRAPGVQAEVDVPKAIHSGWTIVLTSFAAASVIGFGWAGVPGESRSWNEVQSGLRGARTFVEESGLVLVGIAISLVAIAITAIAILGISEPDHKNKRRRFTIMSIVELLLFLALLFLMGCVIASVLGYAGLVWDVDGGVVGSTGNPLTFLGGLSIVLWFCVDLIRDRTRDIYISDALAIKIKKDGLQERINDLQEVLKNVNLPLWEGQKGEIFGLAWTAKRALLNTVIVMILGVVATVIVFWVQNHDESLAAKISGALSFAAAILLLQLVGIAFTLPIFLWAANYWNSDTSRLAKYVKIGSFIVYLVIFLWVYGQGILWGFTEGTNMSAKTAFVLLLFTILPLMTPLFVGGARSWSGFSRHYISLRTRGMIDPLCEKLKSLSIEQNS